LILFDFNRKRNDREGIEFKISPEPAISHGNTIGTQEVPGSTELSQTDILKAMAFARDKIASEAAGLTDEELERLICEEYSANSILRGSLTLSGLSDFIKTTFSEMRGFGVIDPLLEDKSITEIMINGPDRIFIEKNGRIEETGLCYENGKKLEDVIQRIVGRAGREVNRANPIVDTRLPDGSRVNVVLPPVALNGPVMTIRRFPAEPMSIEKLVSLGSITEEVAQFLRHLVEAKYNVFISGGTGSGKTTFLGALAGLIPHDERIITIEDSAELVIKDIPNLVSMETRNANSTGTGEVTVSDLIRSSLRMRPERIIVGEVRGPEALDMLQAMNTGHDGSISTGHANSATDMLYRLETMVLQGSTGLPVEAVRAQIASAVDLIIHLSRMRDRSRRVTEITEIVHDREHPGRISMNPLFVYEEEKVTGGGKTGKLVRTNNCLINRIKLIIAGKDPEIIERKE